mmetsp:Transcript_4090/g.8357  ORF Transcript_4090/g.8357 Transcript_4090/m.8357 type:complete len:87 (+) Transcript_4090:1103-1363(+)
MEGGRDEDMRTCLNPEKNLAKQTGREKINERGRKEEKRMRRCHCSVLSQVFPISTAGNLAALSFEPPRPLGLLAVHQENTPEQTEE